MKTTLSKIRVHEPCISGWKKLLKHLGKTEADDDPLSITTILDSNGVDDALWCLRAVDGYDREIRLYAVWCARQVQYLMTDPRTIAKLDVAERYANGLATKDELAAAVGAARAAAVGAARASARAAAVGAARAAAWAAAVGAARAAAWAASWDAAWAASWDAARAAAGTAAEDASRAAQAEELRRLCAEIDSRPAPLTKETP